MPQSVLGEQREMSDQLIGPSAETNSSRGQKKRNENEVQKKHKSIKKK